jgi:predicted nucleotidyltransferase component of viral defense system
METTKIILKDLLAKSSSSNNLFKRNVLKEYLQVLALDYIYSSKEYSQLVFYGGSCLTHCHGLQRLSEDLDFVDLKKTVDISKMAKALEKYFRKETDLEVKSTVQKFRVTLKFPLLGELGLARASESDFLHLKLEVFKGFSYCQKFKTEIIPLFKMNRSILVKTFELSTLMATKINAVLHRKWEKTDNKGKALIKAKGRDYFDLMWYLQKEIRPNINCIVGTKNLDTVRKNLLESLEKVDVRSIRLDLEALIEDQKFVKELSKSIKEVIKRHLDRL